MHLKNFNKAKKIAHLDKTLHNYQISRPGNTNSSFKVNKLCIFEEFDEWIQELYSNGQEELAKNIALIAGGFALDIYIHAVETKQSKSIKSYLFRSAKKYYSIFKKEVHVFQKQKFKFFLFVYFPLMFSLISRVYRMLNYHK